MGVDSLQSVQRDFLRAAIVERVPRNDSAGGLFDVAVTNLQEPETKSIGMQISKDVRVPHVAVKKFLQIVFLNESGNRATNFHSHPVGWTHVRSVNFDGEVPYQCPNAVNGILGGFWKSLFKNKLDCHFLEKSYTSSQVQEPIFHNGDPLRRFDGWHAGVTKPEHFELGLPWNEIWPFGDNQCCLGNVRGFLGSLCAVLCGNQRSLHVDILLVSSSSQTSSFGKQSSSFVSQNDCENSDQRIGQLQLKKPDEKLFENLRRLALFSFGIFCAFCGVAISDRSSRYRRMGLALCCVGPLSVLFGWNLL